MVDFFYSIGLVWIFYNEVFKFLEDQGEEHLEAYWLEISKNQEKHTLELFKEKGFESIHLSATEEEKFDTPITKTLENEFSKQIIRRPSLNKMKDIVKIAKKNP